MKPEDVTIVIPTLANELSTQALKFTLASIYETFDGPYIVSENGDANYKWKNEILSEAWPYKDLKIKTQGQCHATNEAAKEVTTDWMLVANDDMIFPPGWFEKFTEVVDNFGLLVASPNLVEPRKGAPPFIEKFCGGVGTVGADPDFDKQCFLDFVDNYKEHENRPIENIVEDGFNLPFLIRKDVWDTVGGYDEKYDPWGSNSDSDLQYKIMLAGITPKRVRSTLVYHFSNTSGTFHPDNQSSWNKNWEYFKEKWGFERGSSPDIWYKPVIPEKNIFHPEWEGKYEN